LKQFHAIYYLTFYLVFITPATGSWYDQAKERRETKINSIIVLFKKEENSECIGRKTRISCESGPGSSI